MHAYDVADERRALRSEIEGWFAEHTGCGLVEGFAEMVDVGDAIVGGERVAGFCETHDRREWLVPLSSQSGLTWRTPPVPAGHRSIAFALSVGFGNGSPLPQPSGRWDIHVNGRLAVSVRVAKHSQLWRGPSAGEGAEGECSLAFAANRIEAAEPNGALCLSSVITSESFAAFGPALLTVPMSWLVAGQPATVRIVPRAEAPSTRWFQLAVSPQIVHGTDIYRAAALLTPARVPRVGGYNLFFGDIHTHSGQTLDRVDGTGCGMGTREENYAYARGAGGLDFYALTDHEWQIEADAPAQYLDLAQHHNEDGRFVCLPGYEFTSLLYGHRNVYFSGEGGTVLSATRDSGHPTMDPERAVPPSELWAALERTGVPFITVPHHPSATSHPFNWQHYHPRHDRLVEVYSCWGSSEYYGDFPRGVSDRYHGLMVRDALNRGLRLGLIASSDGHDGHPGNVQSPHIKHHHQYHHLGSGLVAVLSESLTQREIFDALYARRCYATTGVPIALGVEVEGQPMGSILPARAAGVKPRLAITCRGTNGLDHIRVVKNGRVVQTIPCHGEDCYSLEWEDRTYRREEPSYYYVRVVQVDRESAWSSPIWIG